MMEENTKLLVIDTSLVLAWILPDERHSETDRVYEQSIATKTRLIAPQLLHSEALNALRSCILRKRMTKSQAHKALQLLDGLHIHYESNLHLSKEILEIALTCDITTYDAEYVALAQLYQVPLYTLDEVLRRKLKKHIPDFLLGK